MNPSDLNIEVSPVFVRNIQSQKRIRCNQGGTRSSKTYSILQVLIIEALNETGKVITICRKTFSALKGTAMRDFFEILKGAELYNEKNHNKSDSLYELNGNLFEFVGLDQPQKKRGAKRDKLFINEANDLTYEDWTQLRLRTKGIIYIDYNPSDEFHWIYDKVIPRPDCEFIQSTYLDAYDFLLPVQIEEIELLKNEDENYWRVYGLGEKGITMETVYSNWGIFKELPREPDETLYGLDFGFNHPIGFYELNMIDDEPYIRKMIHKSGMTNSQLIAEMQGFPEIGYREIYADSANPDKIEEIAMAGYNIHPAEKKVLDGIDFCKRRKLHIHEDAIELIKEIKSYKWKVDKNGRVLDEPVKFNDDGLDAVRYGLYTRFRRVEYDSYVT